MNGNEGFKVALSLALLLWFLKLIIVVNSRALEMNVINLDFLYNRVLRVAAAVAAITQRNPPCGIAQHSVTTREGRCKLSSGA